MTDKDLVALMGTAPSSVTPVLPAGTQLLQDLEKHEALHPSIIELVRIAEQIVDGHENLPTADYVTGLLGQARMTRQEFGNWIDTIRARSAVLDKLNRTRATQRDLNRVTSFIRDADKALEDGIKRLRRERKEKVDKLNAELRKIKEERYDESQARHEKFKLAKETISPVVREQQRQLNEEIKRRELELEREKLEVDRYANVIMPIDDPVQERYRKLDKEIKAQPGSPDSNRHKRELVAEYHKLRNEIMNWTHPRVAAHRENVEDHKRWVKIETEKMQRLKQQSRL